MKNLNSEILKSIEKSEEQRRNLLDRLERRILESSKTTRLSKMESILELLPFYEQNRLLRCHPDYFIRTVNIYIQEFQSDPDAFIVKWRHTKIVGCQSPDQLRKQILNSDSWTYEMKEEFFEQLSKDRIQEAYGRDERDLR